jgi:hypothetical protein
MITMREISGGIIYYVVWVVGFIIAVNILYTLGTALLHMGVPE